MLAANLAAHLAREVGARRFVHVSTAYVAGTHSGVFTEDMFGTDFRNTYEQTKCEAERIVAEVSGMEVAIARPSIVMGESGSGWTPVFNVLYWPLRAFARGLFARVPAKSDGRVDVVPVDYVADGKMCVVYDLWSFDHRHSFAIKAYCPRDNPRVPSVAHLWSAADWQEREAYDMFGIVFDGHPDLRRLLMPEDWEGHPARKDYPVQIRKETSGWSAMWSR